MTHNKAIPTIMHGGPLHEDKTFMETTQVRIDKAIELYDKGLAKPILFCVGAVYTGITKDDGWEEMVKYDSETDFIAFYSKYLTKQGVDKKDIITENSALDTVGEVFFLSKIIRDRKFNKIRVITNDFHMNRCLEIYRQVFGEEIEIVPERVFSRMDTDSNLRRRADERETKSLEIFKLQFKGIRQGDMKRFEERLYSKHQLYKNLPEDKKRRIY